MSSTVSLNVLIEDRTRVNHRTYNESAVATSTWSARDLLLNVAMSIDASLSERFLHLFDSGHCEVYLIDESNQSWRHRLVLASNFVAMASARGANVATKYVLETRGAAAVSAGARTSLRNAFSEMEVNAQLRWGNNSQEAQFPTSPGS
jgi:hypothetical protein